MAMRQRPEDLPVAIAGLRRPFAEATANGIDEVGREVRDVAEGLVSHATAVAVGAAEEVGVVDLAVVGPRGGGYMNYAASFGHVVDFRANAAEVKQKMRLLVATKCICENA
jgi:hypothetical protein